MINNQDNQEMMFIHIEMSHFYSNPENLTIHIKIKKTQGIQKNIFTLSDNEDLAFRKMSCMSCKRYRWVQFKQSITI